MAMTHEQIDEQMVDFLYGELPANARAAFEAHVAGCERCRREVESFGRVRAVAHTLLDEAPPARAHDAILRAAREAAAAAPASAAVGIAASGAASAKKADTASAKRAEPARASLWEWLRARWAFPTLAAVGALAVLLLGSRLFLNPDTVRSIDGRVAVSEPVAGPTATSTPVPAPATTAPSVNAPKAASDEAVGSLEAPAPAEAPARAAPVHRKAVAEEKKSRSNDARHAVVSPAGGAGSPRGAASAKDDPLAGLIGPGPRAPAKKADSFDDELDRIASGGPPRDKAPATGGGTAYAPPPPAAEKPMANLSSRSVKKKKTASSDTEELEERSLRGKEEALNAEPLEGGGRAYAQPPPPAAAPAPRYPEAPAPRVVAGSESASAEKSADLAESPPKREQRAPRAQAGKAEPAPAAPEPAPAAAPVAATRARHRGEEADLDEQVAQETLLQRADRLFTQGRWAEAAIAYRDLLRLQPNSPSADRWRRRLSAARAAVATGRPPPPSAR